MRIREAAVEDLPVLIGLAQEFAAATSTARVFNPEHFLATWTMLLEGRGAVVFLAEQEDGDVIGALGGVAYPDINSGELIATEFFWFCTAERRGGGLALYRAFEEWARRKACVQIRMVHLMDVEPLKTARVYMKLGFRCVEMAYAKEV